MMDDARLEAVLAKLYPDPGSLNRVLMAAGVDTSRVEQSDRAIVAWHNALTEAAAQGRVAGIVRVATAEYPDNQELADAVQIWRSSVAPAIHAHETSMHLGHTIQRVERLEREVRAIWRFIIPPPRRRVSLILSVLVMIAWWTCVVTLWPWYVANIMNGVLINAAFPIVAYILWWLGQEDRDDSERS